MKAHAVLARPGEKDDLNVEVVAESAPVQLATGPRRRLVCVTVSSPRVEQELEPVNLFLTPFEAQQLGEQLIAAARRRG